MNQDKAREILEARCPYPDCASFGELESIELSQASAICTHCNRPYTARSQLHHQEMVKKINALPPQLEPVGNTIAPLVVVLEDLRSLHNVGATFRTADGAGFGKLYLCGITGVPPRNQITKVSLGSEETVAWSFYPCIASCLSDLKALGYLVVGLEKNESSQSLYRALVSGKVKAPLALVIGNEVAGLSREALYLSDVVCHLGMKGMKESLNVSVAFGAAAYIISEFFDAAS
ncbi:MAG: TrmH family RNA methyltransferase [Candidatus Obscuribacter sp.]|nr:TrmH family RNA methyltransferase [Candidatus Obscuribacter sp.]MDQ5967383.1 SpoU methylase protein [Cyanobacteriota bacterium erpe_2018_sw_39hr_WHONDRS-SW48-000098_B_bin.30]